MVQFYQKKFPKGVKIMNIKYNEIQELLRSRADLHARLNLMPYDGTPEMNVAMGNIYMLESV